MASVPDEAALGERLRCFFTERIWSTPARDLPRGRALLYRASRVASSTVQGFTHHRLTVRAAALTYYTVLSIVPFLAFAFAILKGFGAYQTFVDGTVRPWVHATFGANPALLGSIDRIIGFVDKTNVSALGAVGLVALVYTCVSLVSSVEDALNDLWGATTKRSFLRQVTDYVTLLVTTPLLVMAAGALFTAAQSSAAVEFLRQRLGLGVLIDLALRVGPLAVVAIAFFGLYVILPNVRIRPLSAALGALVAAVLWHVALVLYVKLQLGVSSYNALYSALSAVPIFLVWTYVSWTVVLVGAQVGASHQNERALRQRLRVRGVDQAVREELALVLAAEVAHDFLCGGCRGAPALAERLHLPATVVDEVLGALVRGGVLARTAAGRELRYLPARDVDLLRVEDVREALRRDPEADALRAEVEGHAAPAVLRVLGEAEEARRRAPSNLTLRELAGLAGPTEPAPVAPVAPTAASAPPPGDQAVLDAK